MLWLLYTHMSDTMSGARSECCWFFRTQFAEKRGQTGGNSSKTLVYRHLNERAHLFLVLTCESARSLVLRGTFELGKHLVMTVSRRKGENAVEIGIGDQPPRPTQHFASPQAHCVS